jgi:hypothetical protein
MANVQDVQDQNKTYDENKLFTTPIDKVKVGALSITKLTEFLNEITELPGMNA